jgi:hypothetical protein
MKIFRKSVKLVEILNEIQSDVGAPCPKMVAGESVIYLAFYLENTSKNWDGTTIHVRQNTDTGIVLFCFKGCAQFKFGYPNNEAIYGHPYFRLGLKPYKIFEVENSDWIDVLEKQNSVHPYHQKKVYQQLKHYIFFFHDNCFEIVCNGYEYEIFTDKTQDEIVRLFLCH